MGEISRGYVSILEDDSLSGSKELTMVEPHLEEAAFTERGGDIVMSSDTPSIEHIDTICSELFDLSPISSSLPPTIPSYTHAFYESLCDIRGYNPSFDPYCA